MKRGVTKPTLLHKLDGTLKPKRHRLRSRELRPVGELKEPPLWMNAAQKGYWYFALKHSPAGLFKQLETSSLTNWVMAFHTFEELAKRWNALGNPVLTKNGLGADIGHPLIGQLQKQSATLTRTIVELGFSPASRSRILMDEEQPEEDEQEAFFDDPANAA